MQRSTTSSRPTWRTYFNVDDAPRLSGFGHRCARSITFHRIQLVWESRGYPPSVGHLAWLRGVDVVQSFKAVSSFPGLVRGTAQQFWLCPGVTHGGPGNRTMIALVRRSLICSSWNPCGPNGQLGTLRRTISSAWLPSWSTTRTAWWIWPSCGKPGELGRCQGEPGGTLRWCRSRQIWLRGGHHGPEQSDPCGAGLEHWREGRNPFRHAERVDYPRRSCVPDVSPPFAVPAPLLNVQVVTPLYVLGLPQLLRHDVAMCCMRSEAHSAVFSPSRRFLVLVVSTSAAAMAYHPGVYALQAAEAEEETFSADTAMERVAGFRVSQWREQWGLLDEADFAFAFASYDSAVAHGGHHVADAWVQARTAQMDEDLIPKAAAVAASSGSRDRPAVDTPAPKASMLKRSRMVQALRLRAGPDQPEQVLARAEALRKAFSQAKVMRPQGELTPERYSQWQSALDRMAKQKVTEAEGVTVLNALKSWAELRVYMEQKDRIFPPDALDLYGFLQAGTKGPYRAYYSLKWFSKHGRLGWDFSDVPPPERKTPVVKAKPDQAVAVEPPMIVALEERVQSLYEAGDPRWRGLLSSWMVCFGVLRYKHIERARMVKLTPVTMHGYCPKGKQKANRGGFSFSIPATFISGWQWASALFRDINALPKDKQQTAGLCFDGAGVAYTLKTVNELNREVFENLVGNPEDLSSYSWRRAGPTAATLMKFSPVDMCALGDWADRSQIPKEAAMPLHYSAARYEHSLRSKHCLRLAMERIVEFETWETVPEHVFREALEYAKSEVDRILQQEGKIIWTAPASKHELEARFQLTAALKSRAEAKRAAAQAKGGVSKMPSSVNGKVLSAFMKNGSPLCGDYQMGRCQKEKDDCTGMHLCAVMRKSGRVCGGNHKACECRDKKFMKVEEMPKASSGAAAAKAKPSSAASGERPPEPEVPPRRAQRRPASPERPPPKASAAKKAKSMPRAGRPELPVLSSSEEEIADEDKDLPIPEVVVGSASDQKFDRLATIQGKTAEAPSLIYENRAGGKLWLSGLPTRRTEHRFPKGVTLQIACMAEAPSSRGGVILSGALLKFFCVTSLRARKGDLQEAWPLVQSTLFAGESVLVHCLSGRHRAGVGGCLLRALLAQEPWDVAVAHVKSRRPTLDIPGIIGEEGMRAWVDDVLRSHQVRNPFPEPCGYLATARSKVHLEINTGIPLCAHKQASDKAVRLVNPMHTKDMYEAMAWNRPFCDGCLVRAAASWHPR